MSMETKTDGALMELITFRVGSVLCGINLLAVQEINKHMDVTKVPQAEECVKGVLNLRGRIVTVMDLGLKLGLTPTVESKETRNIVVDFRDEQIGFLVDGINDVLTADPSEVEPSPANQSGVHGKFFTGVFKTDSNLIGILDMETLLAD